MDVWPKISIITPSYNQGAFIEQTILSVLEQNYPNLEYIIIDGASTDNTVDIIQRYSDKLAYWVSEKDDGQTNALNKGFHKATGEIVAWLNSDDMYCPCALETVAKTFMANPDIDLAYGNNFAIDENGDIIRDERKTPVCFTSLVILGSLFAQPATFWKRSLFEKYGYLDEGYFFSMDYEFFSRIWAHINAKFIRKHLAKFRWHPQSKSSTSIHISLRESKQTKQKYLKEVCRGWPRWMIS